MTSLFARVAALVSLSSLLAAPALAHGNVNASHSGYGNYSWRDTSRYVRSMSFGIDAVQAKVDGRDLTVRFRADMQSLRLANRAGIFPVLTVQAGNQFFQVPINQGEGVARFRIDRRNDIRNIQISVAGANGRFRIDNVILGGFVSPRFTVPVAFERGRDRDRDRGRDRDRDDRDNRYSYGYGHH